MELTIQSENWSKSAICMSPQKKKRLDAAMISKSPVKLRKFNLAKGKVFISDATEINSVDPETLNFTHNAKLATDAIVSLKDLESLASGQFVNVKANIHKIGELVTHALRDGKEVSKKEVVIRDDNAFRLLFTMYGEDGHMVEEGKTYILKNTLLHEYK